MELAGGVAALIWFVLSAPLWERPRMAMWLVLTVCRLASGVLGMVSFGHFQNVISTVGTSKPQSNGRNLKAISSEYNMLVLTSYSIMLSYVACLFEPGWPASPPWQHTGTIYMLAAWSIYRFLMCAFLADIIDPKRAILGDYRTFYTVTVVWPRIDFAAAVKAALKQSYRGPLTRVIESASGEDIVFLRAVQAGVPDQNDELFASVESLGKMHIAGLGEREPKVTQLLVRPEQFETAGAMNMHDLSAIEIEHFNQDLCIVLKSLPSADVIHLPYGSLYKLDRRIPFIRLSLSDYAGDQEKLGLAKEQPLNSEAPSASATDLAYDITEHSCCRGCHSSRSDPWSSCWTRWRRSACSMRNWVTSCRGSTWGGHKFPKIF
eukprot:1792375-Prymnesium_polylepis.1